VAIGGAFLGAGTGLAMMRRWACFSAGGPLVKRAVRFAIGLISVGVVYLGLRAIFPTQPEALGLTLRFIRYGLLTWVVSFAVPWLALKLKLAEPA